MKPVEYPSMEEGALSLPTEHEDKMMELDGVFSRLHELAGEDLPSPVCNHHHHHQQQPGVKPSRPNKARRAFRHAQFAVNQFIQRRRRADDGCRGADGDDLMPLAAIQALLDLLDIRGVADATGGDDHRQGRPPGGGRTPARPCPAPADQLYDRLVCSRAAARRRCSSRRGRPSSLARQVLGSCSPGRPARLRWSELPALLGPVLAEVEGCLGHVGAFRSMLDLETEGSDAWLDLSGLRASVFRLAGYGLRDVEKDLEAWAFGLPCDLARLLYPQGGRFDHAEMAMNLDELVLGPGYEALSGLGYFMHCQGPSANPHN